jgi:transposase
MWYAGIDWADQHHDILVINDAGRQVSSLRVMHTAEGLSELTRFLETITGPQGKDQMACILETSHGLLIAALLDAGFTVYPVNPKTVDRHRKPSGAKTDAIDAYLLARTGRSDLLDLRPLKPDTPIVQELKALTRDQDSLIQSQTRLVNQLTACLKAYYPVALTWFSKLQQHSTLVFLQTYPTPQAARAASVEEITHVLKQAGHPTAPKVAQRIFESLKLPHLTADAITTRTKSRLMLALVSQLLPLLEQIAAYDKEIAALFLRHTDQQMWKSLPGAGKRLAPRLLAEWGDERERYANALCVQALAGTSPVPFQSGTYAKMHMRYACLKPRSPALYQFAWQSTKQEPWALTYYRRKRAEGKSHSMAVRALANMWARIIYAMWIKHECYCRATFEHARFQHAPRAA